MATPMRSLRLADELWEWLASEAKRLDTDRTKLIERVLDRYRDSGEAAVAELRAMTLRQSGPSASEALAALQGVGDCPDRPGELGHIWKSAKDDERRSCRFCGRPGRDNLKKDESGGFFAEATGERVELFSRLRTPDSAKGIKPKEKAS
jgi:hypothetical protein